MKMMTLITALLLSSAVLAEESKIVPVFLEAAEIYVSGQKDQLVVRPELNQIMNILEKKGVTPDMLAPVLDKAHALNGIELIGADKFDGWKTQKAVAGDDVPAVALQATGIDVVLRSEIFFKDDIYGYFFMTDGVIPTGKVTSIYKGIDSGESFFFNEVDRAIFPLIGIPAKKPDSHLIVDYGIIESDGDDIKKMQKLSSVIIDIAIAVYAAYDPQHAEMVIKLRQEIKTLADLLLTLNSDDRLATGSFGLKNAEIAEMLKTESYVEFQKNHKKEKAFEYNVKFRLLRN